MESRESLYNVSNVSSKKPYYKEIMMLHQEAINKSQDIYTDPETGLAVLTAEFLLKRGYCCETGCRHCPFYTK